MARIVFEEGWNRQEFADVRRVLADEIQFHVGGATRLTNAAELAAIIGTWHAAFADFRFDIHSVTTDENMAAVRATLHGTQTGPWGGLEPTGRSIAVDHAFFLRAEEGLVVEVWEILDRSQLETQLTGS